MRASCQAPEQELARVGPTHRRAFLNEIAAGALTLKAASQTERACLGVRRARRTGTQTIVASRMAQVPGKASGILEVGSKAASSGPYLLSDVCL
jgi:hypothetical protein